MLVATNAGGHECWWPRMLGMVWQKEDKYLGPYDTQAPVHSEGCLTGAHPHQFSLTHYKEMKSQM